MCIDGIKTSATNYSLNTGSPVLGTNAPSALPPGITAPLTIGWAEGGGYFNGKLDDLRIYNRALTTNEIQQLYAYEAQPTISVRKAVSPSFSNLYLGTNYQLQVSTDLSTWTNSGSPFTPTNTVMDYPQYFDVDDWNSLYFRLQTSP